MAESKEEKQNNIEFLQSLKEQSKTLAKGDRNKRGLDK